MYREEAISKIQSMGNPRGQMIWSLGTNYKKDKKKKERDEEFIDQKIEETYQPNPVNECYWNPGSSKV